MDQEQKKLLLQIAELISKDFYLEMNDHWGQSDFIESSRIHREKARLIEQYESTYGELPEWKYISDVLEAIDELKKEVVQI